jgi:hypothetical protein
VTRPRALALLLLAFAGCATPDSDLRTRLGVAMGIDPPEIDKKATFAAYRTSEGFAIARIDDGRTGSIDAAGFSWLTPTFRVTVAGTDVGEVRLESTAEARVRLPDGASGGSVDPSWDDQTLRLTIRPATGVPLHTRNFRAAEASSGWTILSRNMQASLDLRGTYRADLRDPDNHVVGWLQVRVWEPSGRRVYEAVFPQGFPPVDMAAAAVALDSEVQWIRRHVTDSFQGSAPRIGP